ncbi:MAG: heme exporter protein CcmD [Gammaproteobacteria bacterium]|nr:heme exporter protein CcmD [Gammaproteobacteria bacterium]
MSEFFHMGGYAFYVWASYGLALVLMLWNVIVPIQRKKQQLTRIKRKLRHEQGNNPAA